MTIKTPIILGLIIASVWVTNRVNSGRVLSEETAVIIPTLVPSPTPSQTPTPTPMPTITPTPKPTLIPSPTSVPQPKVNSQQIYEFTNRFGGQYGVDPNVLRHVALCESGFRPDAKNNIYAGLYQFDSRTWKTYREKMGEDTDPDLRFNGEEAVQTAAYAISLGKLHLWPNCKP